jgi:hypothetical protein
MHRQVSRSGIGALALAGVLAACQQGTGPSPAASPTSAPIATASPRPSTSTPASPAPSAVDCPTTLPTTVAVADLADPTCYGTTELAIEGWLADTSFDISAGERTPGWTNAFSGLYPTSPSTDDFIVDFLLHSGEPGVWVVAPPASNVELSELGRWVSARGHFNDPDAMACAVAPGTKYPEDLPSNLHCERLFVVTELVDLDHPAPSCPTESPLSISTFLAADVTCSWKRTVEIIGWEDVGEGFGGIAPIYPISTGSLELAHAQLVANRWESNLDQHSIFPWIAAGSGIAFDRNDREVVVTAVLGGPAAVTCKPAYDAWTWAPPAEWAQHRCWHLLVITEVRDRS